MRKCVVWDLDGTLWDGVLVEGDRIRPRPGIIEVIRTLDARGVLHSVASRSDAGRVKAALREQGLDTYFLAPQIGWGPKSKSIARIAETLCLDPDSFAFVDDDPFERAEVASVHPGVLCLDAALAPALPGMPEFDPGTVTPEAARRRQSYQADVARAADQRSFDGGEHAFLRSMDLRLRIEPLAVSDLDRAEELTCRTHQINSTGVAYRRDELAAMAASGRYRLLVARLADRWGDYGSVGLAVVEFFPGLWQVRLLLVSCRVISRGVGAELLRFLTACACEAGVGLRIDFVPNALNRMTGVALRLAGFRTLADGPPTCLEYRGSHPGPPAAHLMVSNSFGQRATGHAVDQ